MGHRVSGTRFLSAAAGIFSTGKVPEAITKRIKQGGTQSVRDPVLIRSGRNLFHRKSSESDNKADKTGVGYRVSGTRFLSAAAGIFSTGKVPKVKRKRMRRKK